MFQGQLPGYRLGPRAARDGVLCGKLEEGEAPCAVFLLCIATALASSAQTFTTLLSFDGTNGAFPGALMQGSDGNFYGTAGTIFEITPSGTLTTLQSFSLNCPNGLCKAPMANSTGQYPLN
jgi:hypothetical protein